MAAGGFDPGAVYNTTLADLNNQYQSGLGGLQEQEGNLRSNVEHSETMRKEAEPGTFRAEQNAATRGGLLRSGINTSRKEGIAAKFANQRISNQARLTQGLGGFQRQREGLGLTKEAREHGAQATLASQREALNLANPPLVPGVPAQTVTAGPQAGAPRAAGNVSHQISRTPLSATKYYNPLTKKWETRI